MTTCPTHPAQGSDRSGMLAMTLNQYSGPLVILKSSEPELVQAVGDWYHFPSDAHDHDRAAQAELRDLSFNSLVGDIPNNIPSKSLKFVYVLKVNFCGIWLFLA
ncbi:hypothetical protein RHGRI_004863 [Rhododendron griersonianum]|uniref:Uncharacterized protein n=1 Tax=Rhododendron griersonianum TaxID=479676 RepID=A0AAV6LAH7_9ERIC|nr:hypothetical protein RHGRI_004863 [Rhododendron griersonianum]